jgi:isocitrate lyase
VADPEIFSTNVPDGDYVVTQRDTRWLVRRVVGDRASQTTFIIKEGESPAVAQALIFARNDGTAVWLRVEGRQFRLIQSFRET